MKDFLLKLKREKKTSLTSHTLSSLLLHQWMSSSIIMHSFIVLLLCQCLNSLVYREKISLPPLPLCLSRTLSLSLLLLFHIFKCQLYLCGLPTLWSFDVFSSSVSVCECVSGSSSVSVLIGVSSLLIKDKSSPPPLHPISISLYRVFFTAVYLQIEMQSMCWLTCCLGCQYGRQQRLYQGSRVSWPEVIVPTSGGTLVTINWYFKDSV